MRTAQKVRKTKETEIKVQVNLDGKGKTQINTGIGILDHMLELFAFHGLFDLTLKAEGDLRIDTHHTNEDIGIVLGDVFRQALGDMKGIKRFGWASVPMGAALARVALDISGRGGLFFSDSDLDFNIKAQDYSLEDFRSFLEAYALHSGITINIDLVQKEDTHHQIEGVFKALALALLQAVEIEPRREGVPSTKGLID
ncbi:MAG: imidazoleglycerol-phosphate dehydratase HisB [Candidatus Omnitrophica bacterium]|nr:imidazoleglycerol-phosphate dehydratase HisB [Candidatus Omnitrophota bacterium]